jgi:hypothetical protein
MSYIQTSTTPAKSLYGETYLIENIAYGIARTDAGFSVWRSGYMFEEFPDIAEARAYIHNQARLRCIEELAAVNRRAEEIRATSAWLSDDPLRLSRFEVPLCPLSIGGNH